MGRLNNKNKKQHTTTLKNKITENAKGFKNIELLPIITEALKENNYWPKKF